MPRRISFNSIFAIFLNLCDFNDLPSLDDAGFPKILKDGIAVLDAKMLLTVVVVVDAEGAIGMADWT